MASSPRPEDSTEQTIDLLVRASFVVARTLDRCASEYGLTAVQARMLRALSDGAPTVGELGRLLLLDKSSTSGLVDRAARRGLVRRLPSQLDRRSVRVRLTDHGRALEDEVWTLFADELAATLEHVPPDALSALAVSLEPLLTH